MYTDDVLTPCRGCSALLAPEDGATCEGCLDDEDVDARRADPAGGDEPDDDIPF